MADQPTETALERYLRLDAEARERHGLSGHLPWGGSGEGDEDEKPGEGGDDDGGDESDEDDGDDAGDLPEPVKAQVKAAKKAAREARAAARAAEERAAAAEARLKEKDEADLSELERAQNRATEAEAAAESARQTARSTALRYEVAVATNKLNFHDADTAFRLLDESAVQWDEASGTPTNVEALLKALAKERPFLVKSKAEGGVDPTPDGKDKPQSDEEIRKQAGNRLARTRL